MTDHQALPPFAAWAGPRQPKMLLIGEAWGESEDQTRQPFVGQAGMELWRMLGEAAPDLWPDLHRAASRMHRYGSGWIRSRSDWLEAAGIAMTNVFNLRPLGNKLDQICEQRPQTTRVAPARSESLLPLIRTPRQLFLRPEYLPELHRLYGEIGLARPNLIVALGNTACWACLRATNIGSIRGSVASGIGQPLDPPIPADLAGEEADPQAGSLQSAMGSIGAFPKVLPTYHPAGVLYNWAWRSIVIADLMKAFRECEWPEIRRPAREVLVNPSLAEIYDWINIVGPGPLAVDIETAKGQITCIGFATSATKAMVVSFWDPKTGQSFWQTWEEEVQAWQAIQCLLETDLPKLFQNGLYDLQYITRMGIRPRNCLEDSMLLHHSLHPEMLKGLGFLGSIYSDEASWKLMRRKKADTVKADE